MQLIKDQLDRVLWDAKDAVFQQRDYFTQNIILITELKARLLSSNCHISRYFQLRGFVQKTKWHSSISQIRKKHRTR